MSTYNSTNSASVNANSTLKCKRFIVDPVTGKGIPNPEWTPELESQVIALTKVKTWNPTPLSRIKLMKANLNKVLPNTFNDASLSTTIIDKLIYYEANGQHCKADILAYFYYYIVIKGYKRLYMFQRTIARVLGYTREWINKMIAELCEEGLIQKKYRHMFSSMYSLNSSFFLGEIRDQLSKFFPFMNYFKNKDLVNQFTHHINLGYINKNLVDNVIVNNVVNSPKRENTSKMNSQTEKDQNLLASITSVLCAKMKAF